MMWKKLARASAWRIVAWVAAVLVTAAVGSLVQSQFNLAAIRALDAPVPLSTWLMVTLRDLVGFGLFYAVMIAVTLACALTVASVVTRFLPQWRTVVFCLAGGGAVIVFLLVLAVLAPAADINILPVTRYLSGTLLLIAGGLLGGWVYARLAPCPGR